MFSGYCVGRVRFVFSIPKPSIASLFPANLHGTIPGHLAYIEWFTPFNSVRPGRDHQMYKVSKMYNTNGSRKASIIPVNLIRQSVHLYPIFGAVAPAEWKSSNVLDLANEFLVNSLSDRFQYCTLI